MVPVLLAIALLCLEVGADQLGRGNDLAGWTFIIGLYYCCFEITIHSFQFVAAAESPSVPDPDEGSP